MEKSILETESKILVVDDEENNIIIMKEDLENRGYLVISAPDGETGIKLFKEEKPNIVLLDVMMPGIDGVETLKRMRQIDSRIPIIMCSAYANVNIAVDSMKIGATDFFLKPVILEQMSSKIKNLLETEELRKENLSLKKALSSRIENTGLYGKSKAMEKVISQIEKISLINVNILILGESGTGKELVAKAIHNLSERRNEPFIAINCGAIPKDLVESELFGHEKGAFTGAIYKKMGKFELAHKGTLFLDEIADLPIDSQVKLLRAIEEQEIQPIGSTKKIKINVRIISATNKDLEQMVKEQLFRDDLYFRLNVFPIYLPPLRDRKDDIILLANHFLAEISNREGNLSKIFSNKALDKLMLYNFKGNIRELQNIVERAYILTEDDIIEDIPYEIFSPHLINDTNINEYYHTKGEHLNELLIKNGDFISLEEIEKMAIKKALEYYSYNLSNTARKLKIGRDTLYRKIKNYNIEINR